MEFALKTKRNDLIGRNELSGSLKFTGATPSNAALGKAISEKLKADEKMIVVKHIYSHNGSSQAEFSAYVYDSEERKKQIEPQKKEKKAEGASPAAEKK